MRPNGHEDACVCAQCFRPLTPLGQEKPAKPRRVSDQTIDQAVERWRWVRAGEKVERNAIVAFLLREAHKHREAYEKARPGNKVETDNHAAKLLYNLADAVRKGEHET